MSLRYPPLEQGNKTIRVLEIHPGRKRDKVRCSLRICSLPPAAETSYESLSYCWGDAHNKVPILLNSECFGVTRNLHAALVRLRLTTETRRLWVDAICINQDDDAEKSEQVQLMRDIYRYGNRTLVWLGTGSMSSTRRGFQLISKLMKAQETKTKKSIPGGLGGIRNQKDLFPYLSYHTSHGSGLFKKSLFHRLSKSYAEMTLFHGML
jgi:heterokaryon incompatibility protein (HET)